jgi:hypothetical protein
MLADITEKDRTAGDEGPENIKSLERYKKETLAVEARARRLTTSSKSDKRE